MNFKIKSAPDFEKTWAEAKVFEVNAAGTSGKHPVGSTPRITLVPFADAGQSGTTYQVWLPISSDDSRAQPGQ